MFSTTKLQGSNEPPQRRMSFAPRKSIQVSQVSFSGRKSLSGARMSGFERRRTTLVDVRGRRRRHTNEVIAALFHMGSLTVALSLSVTCVIMGAVYWTSCPGNRVLPVILLAKAPLICTELGAGYIMLARNHEWARKLVRGECMSRIHTATGFLFILSGIWFSLMTLWTFEREVSYDPSDKNYCHPHFYRFAFGFVIVVFVLLGLVIFIFFCGCLMLAVLLVINSRLKSPESEGSEFKRGIKPSTVTYGETMIMPDVKRWH